MSQGKATTTALSPSLEKTGSPLAKKKSDAAEAASSLRQTSSLAGAGPSAAPGAGAKPKGPGGPKIYTCYMCGQGFSGSSLGIHQPKCQQKWLAEQAAKPAGKLNVACKACTAGSSTCDSLAGYTRRTASRVSVLQAGHVQPSWQVVTPFGFHTCDMPLQLHLIC